MISGIATALGVFAAILAGMELGRWLRRRRTDADAVGDENAAADGAVFALLGLLVAFTFSSSAARLDERRKLIAAQANAVGTAWSRLGMFAEPDREPLRRYMRDWTKLYLEAVSQAGDMDATTYQAKLDQAQKLQDDAWSYAMKASDHIEKAPTISFALTPISDWMDRTSDRTEISYRGLSPLTLPTLVFLSLVGAVLAGFNMAKRAKRSPLHMVAFAGSMAFCLYAIIDMNHPRSGLIRVDAADHAMREVYASMASQPETREKP